MGQYGSLDYPRMTKLGVVTRSVRFWLADGASGPVNALGLSLFAVGAAGNMVVPALVGPLPGWERTLFFDAEAVGVALTLLSPFVFGIALPLTE